MRERGNSRGQQGRYHILVASARKVRHLADEKQSTVREVAKRRNLNLAHSSFSVVGVDKVTLDLFLDGNATLLRNVDNALGDGKFKAIDEYLASYTTTQKTPSLLSKELGMVVKEFAFKDDKLNSLAKLQSFVSDRAGLEAMIEDAFTVFDQNDARKGVGLPPK